MRRAARGDTEQEAAADHAPLIGRVTGVAARGAACGSCSRARAAGARPLFFALSSSTGDDAFGRLEPGWARRPCCWRVLSWGVLAALLGS